MSSVKESSSLETEVTVWAAYKILVWFAELHDSCNLVDTIPPLFISVEFSWV